MNQQIDKLWTKAGARDNIMDVTRYEKFAKLIVRECINEIKTGYRGDLYTGDVYACEHNKCIDEQIAMLRDYFGVE
tara:strand:+ start:5071 stop:5298 length:228 start_codon:yes stop_codon:yes gene_type:complete